MTQEQTSVLIVGAGGAGLSSALFLLQRGIRSTLIERRPTISVYPRARNLNFRTLEVLRSLGLREEVQRVGSSLSQGIVKETLASEKEHILDYSAVLEQIEDISPDPFGWHCPQSRLEPIMLAATQQRGGDVRYHTELISFTQDEQGVTATLKDGASAQQYLMRADYLIAADGAHSAVRKALGIPTRGVGVLPEHFLFVYFRAPWQDLVAGREADGFMIKNTEVQGIFLVAKDDLGMFMLTDQSVPGKTGMAFTPQECKELVEKAIGRSGMPVEIVDIARWQPAENVAERFQQGRVFLVGDAAHTMPAYKGLGVNTAIQSAQNLAWKLAAVLKGEAGPALLTTYQTERHPVGQFAARQSLTGPSAAALPRGFHLSMLAQEQDYPLFYPIAGYRYRSQSILSEDATSHEQEIALLDRPALNGLPGTRVPHMWLEQKGKRISTLDLCDGRFIFIAGERGAAWYEAAMASREHLQIELAAYRIGPDADLLDLEHTWTTRMNIASEGAVLVRPDGFVAWRTDTLAARPESVLEQVLAQVLCRTTTSTQP